jgi:hypothetical protein
MAPRRPDGEHGPVHEHRVGGRRLVGDDGQLLFAGLIAHGDAADAVVDRTRDARRADGVERVHGGHQPEPGVGAHHAEAGDVELSLRHHRDQEVEGFLGDPVDLLDVEERAAAQGVDQGTVHEDRRVVALVDDLGRVEAAGEARRGQLRVALHEDEPQPVGARHRPQYRRLPGPGRAVEEHVAARVEGRHDELHLPRAPDDELAQLLDRGRHLASLS